MLSANRSRPMLWRSLATPTIIKTASSLERASAGRRDFQEALQQVDSRTLSTSTGWRLPGIEREPLSLSSISWLGLRLSGPNASNPVIMHFIAMLPVGTGCDQWAQWAGTGGDKPRPYPSPQETPAMIRVRPASRRRRRLLPRRALASRCEIGTVRVEQSNDLGGLCLVVAAVGVQLEGLVEIR